MILDLQTLFSGSVNGNVRAGQAITATALSTNVLDRAGGLPGFPSNEDEGLGAPMFVVVHIDQAFNNLTSLKIELISDASAALTSAPIVHATATIPLAALVAGARVLAISVSADDFKRYIGLRYTVVGTAPTTGALLAFVTPTINKSQYFATAIGSSSVPSLPTGTLQFTAGSYTVGESGGTLTVNVSRTGGSSGAASVRVTSANGTAIAGRDFEAVDQTLNWAADESGSKPVTVTITSDTLVEGDEAFTLSLSAATGAALGSVTSSPVTITDDDTASAQVLRTVSPYNRAAGNHIGITGATRRFLTRRVHKIGSGDASEIRLKYDPWYYGDATGTHAAGAHSIVQAWVQANVDLAAGYGGARVHALFGGSATKAIADGAGEVVSDAILPSAFGLSTFALNSDLYCYMELDIPAGSDAPLCDDSAAYGTLDYFADFGGSVYDPATTSWANPTDNYAIVNYSGSSPAPSTSNFGCNLQLVGKFVSNTDPITAGFATDSIGAVQNGDSYMTEAVKNFGAPVAAMQAGRGGGLPVMFNGHDAHGLAWVKYVSHVFYQTGTNAVGGGLSALQSDTLDAFAGIRAAAVASPAHRPLRLVAMKLLCYTTSTDGWTTLAGQTPVSGWEAGGIAAQYNAWLSSINATTAGPTDVFDVSATIRGSGDPSSPDYYKWGPNNSSDGLHPWGTNFAVTRLSYAFRPVIVEYTAD